LYTFTLFCFHGKIIIGGHMENTLNYYEELKSKVNQLWGLL
jgi:hypothetical protein